MELNVDKTNIPHSDVEENLETSYVEAEVETVEEVNDQAEVQTEDQEAEELAKTEDAEELAEEPATTESSQTTEQIPSKSLSKEEAKIVALKRQMQKALEDNRALQAKLDEIENDKQHKTLKAQYIDRGMDEDYAEQLAKKDVEAQTNAEKLEMLMFRLDHEDVLRKYPESKNDVKRIMRAAKTAGMSVEEVCRGIYGTEPEREVRAKLAAKGELDESEPDTTVSKAQRSSAPQTTTTLSAKDLAKKKEYEQMWRGGQKMTNAEWISIKKTYKFDY